jgi:hypothetical protein
MVEESGAQHLGNALRESKKLVFLILDLTNNNLKEQGVI